MVVNRQLREYDGKELIEFNGKQVVIVCTGGHTEPNQWIFGYANSVVEATVDEYWHPDQLQYVQNALKFVDANADDAEKHKQALINWFSKDWSQLGSLALAYSHALKLVGYNEANRAEDIRSILDLTAALNTQYEAVQRSMQAVKEQDSDEQVLGSVSVLLKKLDSCYRAIESLVEEIEVIEFRLDVASKRGEDGLIKDRWFNKSFFEEYGDTKEAEAVRVILNEAGVEI
jgi:hypothetical protein